MSTCACAVCLLPSPVWAEGTVLCVFVCVLPQNGCKIQLSQNLNKLHLTNLVILDKQWFSTRQASSYRQTWLKWRVKLKTKKLTVQILHERLLNQANGSVLLET